MSFPNVFIGNLKTKRRNCMKKVLMSLLFGAFFLTGACFAQTPPPVEAPAAAMAAVKPVVHHEHHPEIHKAMRKLRGAKQDLEKATQEYGGHKAKAMEAISKALEELRAALESDKT
jgi:hypothetical protein